MRAILGPPARPVSVTGFAEPGFEPVLDAFLAGQVADPGAAQLCVYRDGHVVVDLTAGFDVVNDRSIDEDSLIMVASASKGVQAICVAMLIERGELDPHERVAHYWPEFGTHGKDDTTVAHLLSHSSGVPSFPSTCGLTAWDLLDWDRCVSVLADAPPLWPAGRARAYHVLAGGYTIGEVMRRVTGRSVGEFLATEAAGPLGADFYIGLPADLDARYVPQFSSDEGWLAGNVEAWREGRFAEIDPLLAEMYADPVLPDLLDLDQTREGRGAECPAATGIGSARGLARLYAACIGEVDDVRLITDSTVDRVTRSRTDGIPCVGLDQGMRMSSYGLGFALDSAGIPGMLGPGSFGHPGGGGRVAFAHAGLGVAAAYTCSNLLGQDVLPRATWVGALRSVLSR